MIVIQNSSRLIVLVLVLICAFSCQSKKKAMQASNAAAEKAKVEREAAERKLKADEMARKTEEDKAKWEAEQKAKENETKASAPTVKLSQYFNAIASSGNATSANTSINEALAMFASPETPVLIVISESGGMKDYDKPTTIKNYLNYLKDQKKNINAISSLKADNDGKITELELRKN